MFTITNVELHQPSDSKKKSELQRLEINYFIVIILIFIS